MKAVIVDEFGPNRSSLRVGEAPSLQAGPGEVVIAIEASDINFPDLLYVEGRYQVRPALPFSPGLGGAGRIIRVGEGVDGLSVGQKVLALPEHGSHAEELRTRAEWCFAIPEVMPSTVAAALGLTYQTSWFALHDRGNFNRGDAVLVLGASGGIGVAAVQLAIALGAGKVIAATRGAEGVALLRRLGADHVIDVTAEDAATGLRDQVKEVTSGRGVDIVIDPVGGAMGEAALRTLAWSGRFVVVGFASGGVPNFRGNYLLVKNISVSGLQWTDYRARSPERVREAQSMIFDLWANDKLRPEISAAIYLNDVADAFDLVAQGRARGKVILTTNGRHRKQKDGA